MARKLIHYTDHSCLATNPLATRCRIEVRDEPIPGRDAISGRPLDVGEYPRRGVRIAVWNLHSGRDLAPHRNSYTVNPEEVTCATCRDRFTGFETAIAARLAIQAAYDAALLDINLSPSPCLPDTRLLRMLDAHRLCCGGRGAPLLTDPMEVAQLERDNRAVGIGAIARPYEAIVLDDNGGDSFRGWIERRVAKLEAHEREAMQPAIDEYIMAADLVAEAVQPMLARARAHALAVLRKVRTGELVAMATAEAA